MSGAEYEESHALSLHSASASALLFLRSRRREKKTEEEACISFDFWTMGVNIFCLFVRRLAHLFVVSFFIIALYVMVEVSLG